MELIASKMEKRASESGGMSFMPRGSQYRVSSPDLSKVDKFPYVFKWDRPQGKNIAISKVITTFIDPCEGEMDVDFKVSTRRESFVRSFRSLTDVVMGCDKVENRFVSLNVSDVSHVVKTYFECVPPIMLERGSDFAEVCLDKKITVANESRVMCEGWIYDCSETTVRDIMHSPLYIREEYTVLQAAKLMSEKEVGSVLSIDNNGKVTGVLTERDILRKVAGQGLDPASVTIREVASSPVTTIEHTAGIDEAAHIMNQQHIRRLPIIEDGEIIGVVTDRDLIRAIPTILRRGV